MISNDSQIVQASPVEIVAPPKEIEDAIARVISHYASLVEFVRSVMERGDGGRGDYGMIPGCAKPILFLAGAQKLCQFFQLEPRFQLLNKIEDWTGKEHGLDCPLFHYHYQCSLYRGDRLVAQGEGSCNSLEKKYRYERNGSPNSRIYDQINTLMKMAQKRAFVGATLTATNASQFFSQDMEDLADRFSEESDRPNRQQPTRPQPQRHQEPEEWQRWKSPEDAIAWGCQKLQSAGYSEYAVRAEFEELRSRTPGKVAAVWFAHVLRLLPPE